MKHQATYEFSFKTCLYSNMDVRLFFNLNTTEVWLFVHRQSKRRSCLHKEARSLQRAPDASPRYLYSQINICKQVSTQTSHLLISPVIIKLDIYHLKWIILMKVLFLEEMHITRRLVRYSFKHCSCAIN